MVNISWCTFGKEKPGCQLLQGGNGKLDAQAFGNGKLGFHTPSSRKLTSCFDIVADQIRNTQKAPAAKKSSEQGIPGYAHAWTSTCGVSGVIGFLFTIKFTPTFFTIKCSPSNFHHQVSTTKFPPSNFHHQIVTIRC